MAENTKPGQVAIVCSIGGEEQFGSKAIHSLVRSSNVRISQVFIPADEEIPTYQAEGELILHVLQGQVSLTALEQTLELKANELLYLSINEPFSLAALENSSLLLIVLSPKEGQNVNLIGT